MSLSIPITAISKFLCGALFAVVDDLLCLRLFVLVGVFLISSNARFCGHSDTITAHPLYFSSVLNHIQARLT